jgi:hypothetical protein
MTEAPTTGERMPVQLANVPDITTLSPIRQSDRHE